MNLYSFVSVTFFVLPYLNTLAASLPFFKMFSNHLSISHCKVFEYFLLAKRHTCIRRFRRYYRFLMHTSRMNLRKKILFSLLNSPKPRAVFFFGGGEGCSFPNDLNLEKYGVKIYFFIFSSHNLQVLM